jgi:hypothetical protein
MRPQSLKKDDRLLIYYLRYSLKRRERGRILIINYFILNPLYPPLQLVIEQNLLCQMFVPDCDAGTGDVAEIFSHILARIGFIKWI